MTKQCQRLSTDKNGRLIDILRNYEDMLNVTLGTCNTTLVAL